MEKKDFLQEIDLDRNGQIETKDVQLLGKLLSEKGDNLALFIKENIDSDENYNKLLYAIKPTFVSLIQGPDFKINKSSECREYIILLQFYAKYFLGENVTIDGKYSPIIEELYIKSALKTRKLDNQTFSNNKEIDFFKKWLSMNDSITLQLVTREEFNNIKPNITKKNYNKGDGKDSPQGYNLIIPDDLKDSEIPLIMEKINEISYGEKLPEQSAFKTFQKKLDGYINYLESLNNQFKNSPEYGALLSKIINMYQENYGERKISGTSSDIDNSNIKSKIELQFNDINNTQILKGKEYPIIQLQIIESLIAKELNQYLHLAVFERGTQTLFDYMTVATVDEHKYILDPEMRKMQGVTLTENAQTINNKVESMGNVKNKLKTQLEISDYTQKLNDARKIGDKEEVVRLEKEICNKILIEISRYPRTMLDNSGHSQPSKILETQKIVCVGKSIIAHSFLQELGIKHETLNVIEHSALMVHLLDDKEYYFDPTQSTQLTEVKNIKKEGTGGNEQLTLIQTNIYKQSKIGEEKVIHFGRADPEFGLIGQMYSNRAGEKDIDINEKIIFIERALEINPSFVDGYVVLSGNYEETGNYEQAILNCKKGLKIDPEHKALRGNISSSYDKLSRIYIEEGNLNKALELAKMSVEYKASTNTLGNLGYINFKLRNFDKATINFFDGLKQNKKKFIDGKGKDDFYPHLIDNVNASLANLKNNPELKEKIIVELRVVLSELGESMIKLGKYSNAREIYAQLLYVNPNNWKAYYHLGVIDYKEGKIDNFEENYKKAILNAPDDKKKSIIAELNSIKK